MGCVFAFSCVRCSRLCTCGAGFTRLGYCSYIAAQVLSGYGDEKRAEGDKHGEVGEVVENYDGGNGDREGSLSLMLV